MGNSILGDVDPLVICLVLLLLMMFLVVAGNRMRRNFWKTEEDFTKGGVNALVGALFGLWGFILAFAFSQSGTRFENLNATIVDEASVLRSAILKADLFPDSIRAVYRSDLRKYLEERISYYNNPSDNTAFAKNGDALTMPALALWARTVELSKRPEMRFIAADMSGSLISLFDINVKSEAKLNGGVPKPITFLLIFLSLSICIVAGFATPDLKSREWTIITVFVLVAATIIYITIDMSRPLQGLIKPHAAQKAIINLRTLF